MSSPGDGTSSEPIPQDATTFRADGLREAMIGEETLVLDRSNAQCHVLNSSSSAVWRFMGEELTIGEMVEVLVTETGLDRDFVLTTAEAAVRGFIDAGLVDVIPPTEAIIDRHSAEPEIDPEQFAQDLDAAEHAQRRADRSARRRSWLPTLSRTLDRIPELTVHGPWQFGDSRATIATDSPAVGAYLERILHALTVAPDGAANHTPLRIHIVRRGGGGQERVSTYFDGYRIVRRTPPAEAIEITLRNLNLLATTHTRESILLHAGAVEFDGRVVVVTGESGRGKSTLTAALVLAGGAYLTDELVIIDPQDLSVRPYPKPLDLGPTSLELLGLPAEDGFVVTKRHVAPVEIGAVSAGGKLAAVVILGPERLSVEEFGPVAGVAELLPNVFAASHDSIDSLVTLAEISNSVPIVGVPRSAPRHTAATVMDLLQIGAPTSTRETR